MPSPRSALALLAALTGAACGNAGAASSTSTSTTTGAGGDGSTTSATTSAQSSTGAGGAISTSTTGTTSTTSSTSTTTTGAGTGGSSVDPCVGTNAACPSQPPTKAGQGLVPIDRCAFPLVDQDTWSAKAAVVQALAAKLPPAPLADVLADLNRTAVPITGAELPGGVAGFDRGFRWNDGDEAVAYWIPQGLTGSSDASAAGTLGGRQVVLASFYYDKAQDPGSTAEKGVRVAFVDVTADPPEYRFALLVDPIAGATPSFAPVNLHAGGVVWFGDYLYVADTSKGFRVFDMKSMLRVETSKDVIGFDAATQAYYAAGYKYVVPQVGRYVHASACAPIFSFVALDRSTTPPSLISGEYCNGSTACAAALEGRLFRWPLDPATGRLAAPTTFPSEAHYAGQSHLQGAVAHGGTYYLSSSAPAGAAGALYVIPAGMKAKTFAWVDSPEDLVYQVSGDRLWGLSEGLGARYVFAVNAPQ